MRIKYVCEQTGLSDRTVRYYIEEGLLSPAYTENYLGRRTFDFGEEDILLLDAIATLRGFGLSIEEIRTVRDTPAEAPRVIAALRERVAHEAESGARRLSVLSHLDMEGSYTLIELSRRLAEAKEQRDTVVREAPHLRRRIAVILMHGVRFLTVWLPLIAIAVSLTVRLTTSRDPVADPLLLGLLPLSLLPSLWGVFTAHWRPGRRVLRYMMYLLCLLATPAAVLLSLGGVRECDHRWYVLSVESTASCSGDGRLVRACEVCRRAELLVDAALPHTEVADAATPATCSSTGLTEGAHCVTCGAVTRVQQILPLLPHTEVADAAIPATCCSTGLTEGAHCATCGTVTRAQQPLPLISHTYSAKEIAPSCGVSGYTLLQCVCGDSYTANLLTPTDRHSFRALKEGGYVCTGCGLTACEYGSFGESDLGRLYYYITGKIDPVNEVARTLVIYGEGAMPTIPHIDRTYPFRGKYANEIRTVIIRGGVTSLTGGAFAAVDDKDAWMGNPFHSVTSFFVENEKIVFSPEDVSGILCGVTYRAVYVLPIS